MELLWEGLQTEQPNAESVNLDECDTPTLLTRMNREDQKVAHAVEAVLPKVAEAVDSIVPRLQMGGRLIYLGAGTSGRLGILDAVECPPTFSVSPGMVQGVMAGGKDAMFTAVEGAEDDEDGAVNDLQDLRLSDLDVVVGIAASGRTPYVIGGIRYAKSCGCLTISLSCNTGSALGKESHIAIEVETGAEILLGSTRLKAGSAQKMVLNMMSTATMVKLGKVYRNLMVDLKASNHKLRERAKRIVMMVTGLDYEHASSLLEDAGGSVKVAILMKELGIERCEAEARLMAAKGFLRTAVSDGDLKVHDGTSAHDGLKQGEPINGDDPPSL